MIHLLLAIHNHQPVGNFGHVFEKAFRQCYWPVLNTLAEFPKIKISLHHSGPLLDWAEENEPDYIPSLVRMIKSGQIEPLGGGYYEPILAIIPPEDAAGQIKMMRDFWLEKADYDIGGIWMTERIWEPSLASLLSDNGVKYTILDDEHFRAAGITDEYILNYYLTERHGKKTAIFASDKTLRYQIPFRMPEDVVAHLLSLGERFPGSAVTYGDDGEKFGMWPGTFEWVIQKGWLKKFLSLLSEQDEKIKTVTISEFISKNRPSGTVYLPTCSYHEMGEWAIRAEAASRLEGVKHFLVESGRWEEAKPFVRGGYWDNFLTKYPEANYMHKRMLYVSSKLESLRAQYYGAKQSSEPNCARGIASSADGLAMTNAQKALYRAQCNCAYWHGLFGGLYLNYLRSAVYKNLIEAENIIDRVPITDHQSPITRTDIDCDESDEVIFSNKELIAVIKPGAGGSLVEFLHRRSGLNLQNVLTRREEAYHKKSAEVRKHESAEVKTDAIPSIHDISKTFNGAGNITYDPCPRYSFIEHLWPAGLELEQGDPARACTKCNLCKQPFAISDTAVSSVKLETTLSNAKIEKRYSLEEAGLRMSLKITWHGGLTEAVRIGSELNLTLLAGHDESRYYLMPDGKREPMDSSGGIKNADRIFLADECSGFRLKIESDRKMDLWRYPVYTVSQSESGFDLLYQGSCIIWSIVVPVGADSFEFGIRLEFK